MICSNGSLAQSEPLQIPFEEEWRESGHSRAWEESFLERYDGEPVADGKVPKDCARCHSTAGFHDFLGVDGSEPNEVDGPVDQRNGIACVACHNLTLLEIEEVTFPSGMSVEVFTPDARCMVCHQGRESANSINQLLEDAGVDDDVLSDRLDYIDGHYVTAATRFGSESGGGYEYSGKEYEGFYFHDEDSSLCIDCHSLHTEKVEVPSCDSCHLKVKEPKNYRSVRKTKADWDGDGNVKEGIGREIAALKNRLFKAILLYAKSVAGSPMVYDRETFPYFFNDTDGNGKANDSEVNTDNRYQHWTPRLVRSVYNLQYVNMDPGAYVHNPFYAAQLLHDSLADLAGKVSVDMSGMERP
jgi:hypothetical protein|tara:strand:- start:8448 stop:9515 length:1068 start_codon:yes stop_codon:yes gene_type:complete